MAHIHSRNLERRGFTLIEMVIVLGIILLLASLLLSAVMKIMGTVPEVQTRTEIAEFDVALRAFMQDYNLSNPPPSYLILNEHMSLYGNTPLELQSKTFLLKAFGKNLGAGTPYIDWNGNGAPDGPHVLEGEMCLIFYLGGIPDPVNMQCLGFSTNNNNPAQQGGNRKGPYYPFKTDRLVQKSIIGGPFFAYYDPWKSRIGGPQPYAYFSSNGINNKYNPYSPNGDCFSIGAKVWYNATAPSVTYVNSNTYQILSAGKDGQFGSGDYTGGSADAGPGHDDQANFSSRILGAQQQ